VGAAQSEGPSEAGAVADPGLPKPSLHIQRLAEHPHHVLLLFVLLGGRGILGRKAADDLHGKGAVVDGGPVTNCRRA
jgi:hypothetical protein